MAQAKNITPSWFSVRTRVHHRPPFFILHFIIMPLYKNCNKKIKIEKNLLKSYLFNYFMQSSKILIFYLFD